MEGEDKIAALADYLANHVGQRTLSAPGSYFRVLEKITEIAMEGTIMLSFEDLQKRFEAATTKVQEDLPFALRFWHRLGRCIWVEDRPEVPVVVDVEKASKIFGQIICSIDKDVLFELGMPSFSQLQDWRK